MTFSYPVAVVAGTVLLIDTGEETISAEAVFLSGNGSATLTFLYTVSEGDQSVDLGTFEGGDTGEGGGLVGMVLRDSDNPSQVRWTCAHPSLLRAFLITYTHSLVSPSSFLLRFSKSCQ